MTLRHKIRPVAKIFLDDFDFFFLPVTTPNWCPDRYAKFHVDTISNEEVFFRKNQRGGVGSDSQAVAG